MSQQNVDLVLRAFEHYRVTGRPLTRIFAPDFVWDLSTFQGWPEQQTYVGAEGMQEFLRDWDEVFDWDYEIESSHDCGEQVVVLLRLHGRSKATDLPTEMHVGHVWTVRDGRASRMQMYADRDEAMRAVGLVGD